MNAKQAIDRVFESDSGNTQNFWKIDTGRFNSESIESAKPHYGFRPEGVTTKSGIIVGVDLMDQLLSGDPFGEKKWGIFIPNDLFMEIRRLDDGYGRRGNHRQTGSVTGRRMSRLENEILKAIADYNDPDQARAEQAEQRRKDHEKAQGLENRKNVHRAHQRHQASRSPMDYAGGSEDVQGKDYTTQESLN
jgi:hypothetical protein